jgi:hypothetical protein
MVIGAPLEVPADADDALMEETRLDLERRLADLQSRALELLGVRRV